MHLLEYLIVFTGVAFGQSARTVVIERVEVASKLTACFEV
jgi:hypothetical protein